jgi:hypothetical protein
MSYQDDGKWRNEAGHLCPWHVITPINRPSVTMALMQYLNGIVRMGYAPRHEKTRTALSHNCSKHFSPKTRIPDRIIHRWRVLVTFEHPHCVLQIIYFFERIGLDSRRWTGDIHPETEVEMKPEAFIVRHRLALGNF